MERNDWPQAVASNNGEELYIRLPAAGVHFPLRLVSWLTEAVQQGVGLDSQSEIGGILVGTLSQDVGAPNVDVELFVPIPSSSGPFYHLSESELSELRAHIETMGLSSLTVIGLYRTHCRPGLALDQEDEKLAAEFLRQAGSFFLLLSSNPAQNASGVAGLLQTDHVRPAGRFALKPEAGQNLRAALFLRGDESISHDPALIFPFDSVRRDECATDHIQSPERISDDAQPAERISDYVPPAECISDHVQPAECINYDLTYDACELPVSREKEWKRWAAAGGVAVLLAGVLLSGWVWVNRDKIAKPPEIARMTTAPAALHLGATVEQDHLRITWDQKASNIGFAAGTLVIMDGDTITQIPLDNSLLKAGSVQYYPRSSSVRFELRIGEARDVILVAGARPLQSQPAPEPDLKRTSPAPSQAMTSRSDEPRNPPKETRATRSEDRAGPIIRETTPTPVAGISSTKPVSSPIQAGELHPPAQPDTPRPNVSLRFPEPVEHSRKSVIRKSVEPQISPGIDRLTSSQVTIRVRVSIDDQGRVVQADALTRGGPLVDDLAQAAVNAARLWLFEPAQREGRNVPSEAILAFDFGQRASQTGSGQK